MAKKSKGSSSKPVSPTTVFLLIVLGVLIWITPWNSVSTLLGKPKSTTEKLVATPTPTPTPIQLHTGIGNYSVSHGITNGPIMSEVVFNPLDVRKGEEFIVSVQLRSNSPIKSVHGILQSDAAKTELNFTKTGETAGLQTWSTQIKNEDTLWYTYIVSITSVNETGQTTVTVAPRS
jgi:hypothetical protein